jgi:hypothetical protein
MEDLESEVRTLRSKQQVMKLVGWVGRDPGRFGQVMELFLNGDRREGQQASWIVGHCGERAPELVLPYLGKMLKKMQASGIHPAVKRNSLRALQFVEIPVRLQGRTADLCFKYLADMTEPIAVRTFSITVLARIARSQPDLLQEIRLVVREMLPYTTAAFHSRARHILTDKIIEGVEDPGQLQSVQQASCRCISAKRTN